MSKPGKDTQSDNEVHLRQILTLALVRKFSITELAAAALAQEVAHGLREAAGGSEIYIPAADKTHRDAYIRRTFTGSNLDEVRRATGLSRERIYQIARSGRTG